MKKRFYPIILFIICFCSISISQEQLYRNEEHNFRIKFPNDWQIKDGAGPNVGK